MTTITLTPKQIASIAKPVDGRAEKALASYKRRADARVARADARTVEWKQHYRQARKSLIEARSEINELKRRLRNGEFE